MVVIVDCGGDCSRGVDEIVAMIVVAVCDDYDGVDLFVREQ